MNARRRRLLWLGLLVLALPIGALAAFVQWNRSRVAELEAECVAEIEAELHAPPERRPIAIGSPHDGEAIALLEDAWRPFLPMTSIGPEKEDRFDELVGKPLGEGRLPPYFADLDGERAHLAPLLAGVRRAITAERVGPPRVFGQNVEADFLEAQFRTETALVLEAVRDLSRDDPLAAARTAIEHWAYHQDLDRIATGLNDAAQVGIVVQGKPELVLLCGAIARLDATALDEVDGALARLREAAPLFARIVRRDRLSVAKAALRMRAGDQSSGDDVPGVRETKGEILGPIRFVRGWRRIDARYAALLDALERSPPHEVRARLAAIAADDVDLTGSKRPPETILGTGRRLAFLYEWYLSGELAPQRIARLAVACRRFHLRAGRWPATHAEALGREPAPDEVDPFSGKPLTLTTRDGALAISAGEAIHHVEAILPAVR